MKLTQLIFVFLIACSCTAPEKKVVITKNCITISTDTTQRTYFTNDSSIVADCYPTTFPDYITKGAPCELVIDDDTLFFQQRSMHHQLAEFLVKNSREDSLDCGKFAHALYDLPYENYRFDWNEWLCFAKPQDTIFNDSTMIPGECLLMTSGTGADPRDGQDTLFHFAIYLKDGLFLSKLGINGKILAADLENLKKLYPGTKRIFSLIPYKIIFAPLDSLYLHSKR